MPQTHTKSPFAPALTPDEVVRQLQCLPSAPRVLPRLKALLSDGNSSTREVVALVRLDPGIAARVLQIGNSAYYSQGARCYTVDEAVSRVGYNQIYELVANAVASQVLVRPLAAYGLDADELWRMSVACGLAAELFAERLELDRDIAYTVGLLHGVGMVAIDEWAFHQNQDLRLASRSLPLETCEAERTQLGFHNGEAGAALLRLWEFPAVMAEPVRWQYLPRGTVAHFKLACVLHLSKWVRTAACRETAQPPWPDQSLVRAIGVTNGILQEFATEVRARLLSVNSLLDAGLPEKSIVVFPNGEREIAGLNVARDFLKPCG